ncbi:methyltransferase domain-containing protein [Candidatus Poribacteria bacterium]|nr:methyltransferase domain-containing protein [Candidatus Poribacteria bacterium]
MIEDASSFKAELFAPSAQLEAGHFWCEARNALLVWALRKYFPGFKSFLDMGCGTGFILSRIQKEFPLARLAGSDIYTESLACAKSQVPDGAFFQMDARHIPFENEFDIVAALDVLEHIEEDESVLTQMFQATSPGGGIVVAVPQHRFLWSPNDDYRCHKRRYSGKELVEKVSNAGFEVIRVTSFVSLLLPVMILVRIKESRNPQVYDPLEELRISGFLNTLLTTIMTLERFLIKGGLSFPAGGSLFVVAKHP